MKCPACARELSHLDAGGVYLDVCDGGCGGVWFDNLELKKFDELDEHAASPVLAVKPGAWADAEAPAPRPEDGGAVGRRGEVASGPKRVCPRCENIKMMRTAYMKTKSVEVDHCGGCGGYWLDHGELQKIRDQAAGVRKPTEFDEALADYERMEAATRRLSARANEDKSKGWIERLF